MAVTGERIGERGAGAENVITHEANGTHRVASASGGEDRTVFAHGARGAPGEHQLQPEVAITLRVQAMDDLDRPGAGGRRVERQVEGAIGLAPGRGVGTRHGMLEGDGVMSQQGVVGGSEPWHRAAGEVGLQQRAQLEEFGHLASGKRGDDGAAMGREGHQPLGLQPEQPFPQRNPAHPELGGEGGLPQRRPGRIHPVEDPLAECVGSGVGEGAAGGGHDCIQYPGDRCEARSGFEDREARSEKRGPAE